MCLVVVVIRGFECYGGRGLCEGVVNKRCG